MNLKMLLIVYNIALEDEVGDLMKAQGAPCFTQWPRLVGKGVSTGPKMDNDVWPGANSAIFTVLPEPKAREVMAAVQALRDEVGSHEGIKAFLLNVEEMTGDV